MLSRKPGKKASEQICHLLGWSWKFRTRGFQTTHVKDRKSAKQHYTRALQFGYKRVLDWFVKDLEHRLRMEEHDIGYDELLWYQYFGDPKHRGPSIPMGWAERRDRFGHWSWDHAKGGQLSRGRDTRGTAQLEHSARRAWKNQPYNWNNPAARESWDAYRHTAWKWLGAPPTASSSTMGWSWSPYKYDDREEGLTTKRKPVGVGSNASN